MFTLFYRQGVSGVRGGKYIYIILESCVSRSASRETDADTSAWGQSGDVRR